MKNNQSLIEEREDVQYQEVHVIHHKLMSPNIRFPTINMGNQQILRSGCVFVQSDQSLYQSLEYSMSVKLLNEHSFAEKSSKIPEACNTVYRKGSYIFVKQGYCTLQSR